MQAAVAPRTAPRRVCFFGTYARDHTATVLLRQALRARGWEVVECHAPLWEETRDKMPAYFRGRSLVRLALAYGCRAGRLARGLRQCPDVDAFVVGFNGQLDVLLLRLMRRRAPLVFVPLVTISETLIDDRGVHRPGSWMARLAGQLDRWSLRGADRVIIDTEAHRQYLVEVHGVSPQRVGCWHLGADAEVFRPVPPRPEGRPLQVLFYGQFLPLHGLETIFEAIGILAADGVEEFTVVGTGPERDRTLRGLAPAAAQRVRLVEWIPYRELGAAVADADVCLGSFGTSAKARMVIPNKVYQAAAVGRAVVTGDTPAVREVFTPGENVIVCPPGDPAALAEAIRGLRDDAERTRVASNAQRLMASRFGPCEQGARLVAAVEPAMRL